MPNPAFGYQLVHKAFKNEAGSFEMAVDGSGTPVKFFIGPTVDKTWEIDSVALLIEDGGVTPSEFGGLGVALTNGLLFDVEDAGGNVIEDFLDGITIKINAEFSLLSGNETIVIAAAGDDMFHDHITFDVPVLLGKGERLVFTVQDDISGLSEFRAVAEGYIH